ncbi:MAG: hypothetical protein U0361_19095 [Nitrospiraceae bacterium]
MKFGATLAMAVGYYALVAHAFSGHEALDGSRVSRSGAPADVRHRGTVEYVTEGRQRRLMRAAFDKYVCGGGRGDHANPEAIKLGGGEEGDL